jgi:hypothetical protein
VRALLGVEGAREDGVDLLLRLLEARVLIGLVGGVDDHVRG